MSGQPIPKPAKRGPKPKRPIKRSSKPIERKTRIPRVSKSAARTEELAADRKWSAAVLAKGPCAAIGAIMSQEIPELDHAFEMWKHQVCAGPIDPAHGFPRTYRATRFDVSNGFPLCRAAHDHYTRHPKQWTYFLIERMGESEYEKLKLKAQGRTTE